MENESYHNNNHIAGRFLDEPKMLLSVSTSLYQNEVASNQCTPVQYDSGKAQSGEEGPEARTVRRELVDSDERVSSSQSANLDQVLIPSRSETNPLTSSSNAACVLDSEKEVKDNFASTGPLSRQTSTCENEKENMLLSTQQPQEPPPSDSSHLIVDKNVIEEANLTAAKYKEVTCPWWRDSNSCIRGEADCMFAHLHKDIESPSGFNKAKEWTCPAWQSVRGCQYNDEKCLYAHSDTGFYIGLDGKALKKHLTCFWWFHNGKCIKPEHKCLYSHRWTGMVAEEPATKPPRRSTDNYAKDRMKAILHSTSLDVDTNPPVSEKSATFIDNSVHALTETPTSDSFLRGLLQSVGLDIPSLTEFNDEQRETDLSRSTALTNDPRIEKKAPTSALTQNTETPASTHNFNYPTHYQKENEDHRESRLDLNRGTRRMSTNQCVSCGRRVFKMDLCTSCQRSGHEIDEEQITEVSRTAAPATNGIDNEEDEQPYEPRSTDGAFDDDIMNDVDFSDSSTGVFEHTPWARKRKASDSNMFPWSKKQKPDLKVIMSKDTSLKARSNSLKMHTEKTPSHPHYSHTNPETVPMIDLDPQNEELIDDAPYSPVMPAISWVDEKDTTEPNSKTSQALEISTKNAERYESVHQPPNAQNTVLTEEQEMYVSSDSESDKPLATIRARSGRVLEDDADAQDLRPEPATRPHPDDRCISASQHNHTALDVNATTPFTTQRTVLCDDCRRRKRKCLHDEHGRLDEQKCFEWLESQHDSGLLKLSRRSEKEAQGIKAAAMKFKARRDFRNTVSLSRQTVIQHVDSRTQELTDNNKTMLPTPSTTVATASQNDDSMSERTALSSAQEQHRSSFHFDSTVPEASVILKPRELYFSENQKTQVLQIENKSRSKHLAFQLDAPEPLKQWIRFSQTSEIIPPRLSWSVRIQIQQRAFLQASSAWDYNIHLKHAYVLDEGGETGIWANPEQYQNSRRIAIRFSDHQVLPTPDTDDDDDMDELASTVMDEYCSAYQYQSSDRALLTRSVKRNEARSLGSIERFETSENLMGKSFVTALTGGILKPRIPPPKLRLKLNVGEKSISKERRRSHENTHQAQTADATLMTDDMDHKVSASIAKLKARGVVFEDSEGEDDPINDVLPQLGDQLKPLQNITAQHNSLMNAQPGKNGSKDLYLTRITKGQGLKESWRVRRRQMARNFQLHGNPHFEVNRELEQPLVTALTERKVRSTRAQGDAWAPDEIVVRQEKITYQEFLGIAKDIEIEPCLVGQGPSAQLAFRQKKESGVLLTMNKRVKDSEKWPVSER